MADENKFRITYATMSADMDALHAEFDKAVERVNTMRGKRYPMLINGAEREADEYFPVYSPMDTREPLVHFPKGTREDARDAIEAAKAAYPAWRAMPYEDRLHNR